MRVRVGAGARVRPRASVAHLRASGDPGAMVQPQQAVAVHIEPRQAAPQARLTTEADVAARLVVRMHLVRVSTWWESIRLQPKRAGLQPASVVAPRVAGRVLCPRAPALC